MDTLAYGTVKAMFNVAASIFFREIRSTGASQVPEKDPVIFIVGPHANQFVDPGMVLITNPRQFAPLMAKSSFKKKVIGQLATLLKAIPVIRPQDLASKGKGTVRFSNDGTRLIGTDTQFKEQVAARDLISLSKTLKVQVAEVVSDTELVLKSPMATESVESQEEDAPYKIIPHIDQSKLYDQVHKRLSESGSIVIFPEGGSHDRSEMLPLKAGFAIMALGAMAEHPDISVKIVPVGLNYFHPHKFRSRAVISYGSPVTVEKEWVEMYKQGGSAKREAIAALLEAGHEGLKSVTVNAPSYDTLMIIAAARRLYRPVSEHKLRLDQVVELNRRFLLGYKHFENDPRLIELARKVQAYNNTLKYFGLRDHQVERTKTAPLNAVSLLLTRVARLLGLACVGFPALLLNSPIVLLVSIISRKKQKEALAGSNVKIAARDVLATWKVLVVAVFAPILYGFYSTILFITLYFSKHHEMGLGRIFGWSVASYVAQPFLHYAGVRLLETGVDLYKSLNPLLLATFNPGSAAHVRTMREKLSDDITSFVNENGPSALEDFDPHRFDNLEQRGIFDGSTIPWLGHDRSLFNFHSSSSSSLASSSSGLTSSSSDDGKKAIKSA
ncbi:hypothetical protein BDA99DRAFT_505514 [Phascolomyces articulosus]|uniref:Phospholipid/glycerol acyltransferase domain-containing protein n=1 Tax=Phascolomyces articulosus TaxID=60185 RepID=A0AAD5PG26_9FUNG|nr:hypothetical protein BDA99DRAFT_505514 [Phascolomyces articulosus]